MNIDAKEQAERIEDARVLNEGDFEQIVGRFVKRWTVWFSARDAAERRCGELEGEIKAIRGAVEVSQNQIMREVLETGKAVDSAVRTVVADMGSLEKLYAELEAANKLQEATIKRLETQNQKWMNAINDLREQP